MRDLIFDWALRALGYLMELACRGEPGYQVTEEGMPAIDWYEERRLEHEAEYGMK